MVNLNELVEPISNLQIIAATSINDRGEIVAIAFVPTTSTVHAAVLIPYGGGAQKCADSTGPAKAAPPLSIVLSESMRNSLLSRINVRHRFPQLMSKLRYSLN
jgi:hypothetical protein